MSILLSQSLATGFNIYTALCKRAKQSQFCFWMKKSYTNLRETPSLHNQKQKVTKSQQKKTVDVLMKLSNTAEAS